MAPPFRVGALWVDVANLVVRGRGDPISLTRMEARLLDRLWQQRGRTVSHRTLLTDVWGYAATVESRAPHHTLTRLRRKLAADPRARDCLRSVRGLGYALQVDVPSPQAAVDVPPFVGRSEELRTLDQMLTPGALVTVTGLSGIGKTALVRQFVRERPGVRWVSVASADPSQWPGLVAQGLGVNAPRDIPGGLRTSDIRCVVLDGVGSSAPTSLLQDWRRAAPHVAWILTGQRCVGVPGEQRLALDTLCPTDAEALLRSRDPNSAALIDLSAVTARAGGVPLALERTARGVEGVDLQDVVEAGWATLSHADRVALARLSIFVGGCTQEAAEALLVDGERVSALEATSWLQRQQGTYRLLPQVRVVAASTLSEPTRADCRRRHATFMARWGARDLDDRVPTSASLREALAGARADLLEAMTWAESVCDWHVAGLTWLGAHALIRHGQTEFDTDAFQRLLRAPLDPILAARMRSVRGDALRRAGELRDAQEYYEAALATFEAHGDAAGVAIEQCNLGTCRNELDDLEGAVQWWTKACEGFQSLGDVRREGRVRYNFGVVGLARGDISAAEAEYRRALALFVACSDRPMQAHTHYMLGVLHTRAGAYELSRAYIENAVQIAGEEDMQHLTVHGWLAIGNVHHQLGDRSAAMEAYEAAHGRARELGLASLCSIIGGNRGLLHHKAGNLTASLQCYEEALAVVSTVDDPVNEAIARSRLGHLQVLSGARGSGLDLLEQAEAIFEHGFDDVQRAAHWCRRAEVATDPGEARGWVERARQIAERLDLEPTSPLLEELDRIDRLLTARHSS